MYRTFIFNEASVASHSFTAMQVCAFQHLAV